MDTLKTSICDALATFIRQRPGLEYGNYGDVTSYRAECRSIARDKRDAETLLAAVRWRDSITGADLIEAARGAFSGRLTITAKHGHAIGWTVSINYCTGQYWPTEYRRAAAAVLASALWNWQRESMPAPVWFQVRTESAWNGNAWTDRPLEAFTSRVAADAYAKANGGRIVELYDCGADFKPAGDWLRRKFRAEFGSALQRRYFN